MNALPCTNCCCISNAYSAPVDHPSPPMYERNHSHGAGTCTLAGGHDRCSGWHDPRVRIYRRQSGRLAVPLPQESSHNERDGSQRAEFHWRRDEARACGRRPQARTRDMPMGSSGMADMAEMAALENTLPMMSGDGQFGPAEMGGMFTVIKIREGLAAGDYQRFRPL